MFPIICKKCNKEFFEERLSHVKLRVYCSRRCAKIGQLPWNKGIKGYSLKSKGITRQKVIPWNKGLIGYNSGSKNGKWIIDRSKLKKSERKDQDVEYVYWARSIKKRDNWKCKINNNDCKGRLEAHHILSWRDYPELRYDINNGITLCQFHHPKKWNEERRLTPYFKELIRQSSEIN